MGGITLAFSGVNEIYQLSLAAQEIGRLDHFYCSLLDASGKWGGRLTNLLGTAALTNRRMPDLNPRWVTEIPLPFLTQRLASGIGLNTGAFHWSQFNFHFDAAVAKRLVNSSSRIFVGVETCARDSLRAARRMGMSTILDCPQVHPTFLEDLLRRGAENLHLPPPGPVDTLEMAARKAEEFSQADLLIVPSEVCRRSFLQAGFSPERLAEVPLWADPEIWYPPPHEQRETTAPLRVLFVGRVDLRKGIPYLLQAVKSCGRKVQLTMVGTRSPTLETFLREHGDHFEYVPSKTKPHLRRIYWRSDVLVLPSLVDTFGFVAMEAMACGLPVIVSENCGVPVPAPSWRVPIMDAGAIVSRLMFYAENRDQLRAHGEVAARFAAGHTPEVYRRKVGALFNGLLDAGTADM